MRFTLSLRRKIDGYNKGNEYSVKQINNERNAYFEEYLQDPSESFNSKTNQRLTRMDIIYRICHSVERKYIDLYVAFQARLRDMDFFSDSGKKSDDKDIQQAVSEVYGIYHTLNTQSDSLEIDFKHSLTKAFPSKKLLFTSQKLFDLFRVIETIDELRAKILRTPLEIKGETFTEYGASEEFEGRFPDITQFKEFEYREENLSSDEDVEKPASKKKTAQKAQAQAQQYSTDKDVEYINRIEDVQNHFKIFFEKYSKIIFKNEFWSLFLNDILAELKSDKTNEQLFYLFESPTFFDDPEAAHYLIEHRDSILKYNQFMASENERKLVELPRKSKTNDLTNRPSNFSVKHGNQGYQSSEYAAYDESAALGQTNIEILTLLGMDQEELMKESKLGLKKQEIPKSHIYKPPTSSDGSYDYAHMSQASLATCLPLNTDVPINSVLIILILT